MFFLTNLKKKLKNFKKKIEDGNNYKKFGKFEPKTVKSVQ